MKIGIMGAGNIGSALAVHFHKLQHTVLIANSRGPQTLSRVAGETGASPVELQDVAREVNLLIVTVPMKSVPLLPKSLFHGLPAGLPIVDTGNYYPARDGIIGEIEAGLTESEWTASVLGRPVIKAFNNIATQSLVHGALPKGSENRIALPVAGNDAGAKQIVLALIDDMGFDGIDAGSLAESWRQQPGTPVYGTDYGAQVVRSSLASADRAMAPAMRDAGMQKMFSLPPGTTLQETVHLARSQWTEHRAI